MNDLNFGRSVHAWIGWGKEFQRRGAAVGAAVEKALLPQVWHLVLYGGDRRLTTEERRMREGV